MLDNSRVIILFLLLSWLFTHVILSWWWRGYLVFNRVASDRGCDMSLSSMWYRVRLVNILLVTILRLLILLIISSSCILSRNSNFSNISCWRWCFVGCFLFLTCHHLHELIFILLSKDTSSLFSFGYKIIRSCQIIESISLYVSFTFFNFNAIVPIE